MSDSSGPPTNPGAVRRPNPVQGVSQSGWEDAPSTFEQRCSFTAIWGPTSGGKTTLALTVPGPVGLIHSAEKIQGVVQPFVNGNPTIGAKVPKMIKLKNMGFVASKSEEDNRARANAMWIATRDLHVDAFDSWAKSVVLDMEPDAWSLRRYAKFGTLNPQGNRMDILYNEVNTDWRQILKNLYRYHSEKGQGRRQVNLVTIHNAKEEYKDTTVNGVTKSSRTGRMKMEGNKEVPYWADVILWAYKSMEDFKYHVRIDKGWFNGAIEGMDLTDDTMKALGYSDLSWPTIMALITSTPEDEWKR